MREVTAGERFGAELRRRRLAAGWSLTDLKRRVFFSKSHLSKVENGLKAPSIALARQCDLALNAGGELNRLVREMRRERKTSTRALDSVRSVEPSASMSAFRLGDGSLEACWEMFRGLRQFGQTAPPVQVMRIAVESARSMRELAAALSGSAAGEIVILAARFAEYAGWMAQESGDDAAALRWTDSAVELAVSAGDRALEAYSLVRRGLVALYQHDADGTIYLARQAQRMACDSRISGLAAQREAQGHAINGDVRQCMAALERAAGLLDKAKGEPASKPVIGTSYVEDPVAMTTGWCLHDLGDHAGAVRALTTQLERIPAHAHRARSRYGARLALSLATMGQVDEACKTMEPVLMSAVAVDSATVRTDLRRMNFALARWHSEPAVKRISPELASVAYRHSIGSPKRGHAGG